MIFSLCSQSQHLFDKNSKSCNIVTSYYNFIFLYIYFDMEFIPVYQSWDISIISPDFSVTWMILPKLFWFAYLGLNKHFFIITVINIKNRAVQKLIAINRIQNKSLCLNSIFVCAVYNYFVYINTHTCMYIFRKMCYSYIKYLYLYNIDYVFIYIYIQNLSANNS